ncbi:MAG: class I SAM-dependent methyltransferase [Propionibacteriales bacterium]|nr:class I SAM-dependent methyltransferase [Propionibacteriales bacterium]
MSTDPSDPLPKTRWELGETRGYAARFARLIEDGSDVEGEARVADALVPRGARILDAGSGMGRIGAALQARGHDVVAVEKDPELVAESRRRYPDLPVVEADLLALADGLVEPGFDLVVLVGNVIVLLAPETERRLLSTLRDLLAPEGRILVGFHPVNGHGSAREYLFEEFAADVEGSGLAVQHRFGTYELAPAADDYCVAVLVPAD